jgi:hypothetical protein
MYSRIKQQKKIFKIYLKNQEKFKRIKMLRKQMHKKKKAKMKNLSKIIKLILRIKFHYKISKFKTQGLSIILVNL